MGEDTISADFSFESKYIEVHGSKLHYVDEGSGDPILFLHGNPTSSYLWRNIIPHLVPHARCIAPDLIGMGKSANPVIPYRFFDHVGYIEGFIEQLGLNNVTLVIHDWGSALGFHYAMRNENNIKGIAFMEAILKPMFWQEFPKDYKIGFKLMRTPVIGWLMISVMNVFVKKLLPGSIIRKLTAQEIEHYEAPFRTIRSRKAVRQWPCEVPIDGLPADVSQAVSDYNLKLRQSDCPKILFSATPGAIITKETAEWCRQNLKNLTIVDVGKGLHFIQEDQPHLIGEGLSKWYQTL